MGVTARLFRNTGILLGGNAASSVLGLGSVALTTRGLGAELFGILALIRAYTLVVDRLLNFQSWQAMIRYGAEALEHNRREDFKRLITFGVLLDAGTAVLGAAIAAAAVHWVGHRQGWDARTVQFAVLYSLTIGFNLSGTPKAILRLFNRFTLLAAQQGLAAAFKLVGVTIAWVSGSGLGTFVAVWMLTDILGYLLLVGMGWRELAQQGFHGVLTRTSPRGIGRQCPGIWGFVWTTKLNGSIRMALKELDTLVVGGLFGAAAAGLYHVAKQCAKIVDQISDPLDDALYPELARLWVSGEVRMMRRLMIRGGLLAGGVAVAIWCGVLIAGGPFLQTVFGQEFIGAQNVLLWYLLGVVVATLTFPLQSAMLAMGRPQLLFRMNLAAAALYFGSLMALTRLVGLAGAGMAHVVQQLVWSLGIGACVWVGLRRGRAARAIRLEPVPVGEVSS